MRHSKLVAVSGLLLLAPACGELPNEGDTEAVQSALYSATLPSGWALKQFGTVTGKPAALYDSATGKFKITGVGMGSWVDHEELTTVSRSFAGDGEITAVPESMEGATCSDMGIEIRAQQNATSAWASTLWSSDNYFNLTRLANNGQGYGTWSQTGRANPWMKLVRRGNTITAYESPDNVTWSPTTQPWSVTLSGIGAAAYYGLVVDSCGPSGTSVGTFRDVRVGRLALGFAPADVGAPTPAGSTTMDYENGGIFEVAGAGKGVGGTSDAFHWAYRTLVGDGTLIGRIDPPNGGVSVRGGLMLRAGTSSNAASIFVSMDDSDRLFAQARTATGGSTTSTPWSGGAYGGWTKLVRTGKTVATYNSVDGVTWKAFTTVTLPGLGSTAYVGFAVSGGANGAVGTVGVDQVRFQPATFQN